MKTQSVTVKNPTGFSVKPAEFLYKTAIGFHSSIKFIKGDQEANAKSVLSVLGSCVKCGDIIEFICEGDDENEAIRAVCLAVESGLGE